MINTKPANKSSGPESAHKRPWIRRCIIILVIVVFAASIGGSLFLFNVGLLRSETPNAQKAIDASSEFSAAMAENRAAGEKWLEDTSTEQWVLTAEDGIELRGYYIASADRGSGRTAVLIHGYRANAATMGNYARLYHDRGFNVFMADNRAHGKSGGKYIGMGWLDRKDYLGWLAMLIEKTGEDTEIVLHGISMGAAAVMMMGGEKLPPQVKCIVDDCGYSTVFDEFKYQIKKMFGLPAFPFLYLADIEAKLLAGYSFTEASALEAVKKTRVPIFFIHGANDDFNPTYMVYELYEAAQGAKELWVVPGATHGMAYAVNPEEYINRVSGFYEKYIGIE
ncbi:alpha/beta hydrolase [Spirochaetia bacterium]|nr:alpha/beta hydrolase [Spirochaetia bacterium]